jgi:hypothetical protein
MSIRDQTGTRPKIIKAVGILATIVAIVLVFLELKSGARSDVPPLPDQTFYTVDDGATLFKDSLYKIPPIDHNGQQAVRAHVYTADGGQHQWVQYLEKFSDSDKQILESGKRGAGPLPAPLVKRPGSGNWVPIGSQQGQRMTVATPPSGMGTGEAVPVVP